MSISANALFHFTNSADNLVNILTKEFCPKYCLENFQSLFPIMKEHAEVAIPMVAFCDLPLSKVEDHLDFYGNYGIGMRKEWGISNGINPVLYLCPESNVTLYINVLLAEIFEKIKRENRDKNSIKALLELFGFIKPYAGKMFRGNETRGKKFYDEREWRYVPPLITFAKDAEDWLRKEDFMDEIKRASGNVRMERECKISFQPDDIKYIIVKEETEILSMIRAIERIKVKYDLNTVKVLSSRIISAEQIKSDI